MTKQSEEPETESRSRYKRLTPPVESSQVPEAFLQGCTKKERHVVEALARIEHTQEWLVKEEIESRDIMVDLDIRLQKIERWKENLMSKWTLLAAVTATVIVPIAVNVITKALTGK